VYEAGEADGILFIAMRLVPGKDVRTLLREDGPLAPGRVAAIISPVASALDAAHAAGLVHRDVKPANMLIDAHPDRPDHVYLSDFGLSKGVMSSAGLTGTGQFLGTPDYTAPEQIQGRAVDGRADQYALACTAFELLVGDPPFQRDHGMAVIWAHVSEPPPSVGSVRPGLPEAVDEVFARALAKAPQDRFASCGEFAETFRAALGLVPYHPGSGNVRPGAALGLAADASADRVPADVAGSARPEAALPVPEVGQGDASAFPAEPVAPAVLAADGEATHGPPVNPGNEDFAGPVAPAASAATRTAIPPGVRAPAARTAPGSSQARRGQQQRRRRGNGRRDPGANDVAFSPDGSLLATAGSDGMVRLWEVGTAALAHRLAGHAGQVRSVGFSPDGRMLAAASSAGRVRVWETAIGMLARTVTPGPAWAVAFSPDGRLLATAGGGIRPAGGIVAAAGAEQAAWLWDVATGRVVTGVAGQRGHASAVAFNPDGSLLATGSARDVARLWDVATGKQVRSFPRQTKPAGSIAFGPDGRLLATAGAGNVARLWDAATGELVRAVTPEPAGDVAFSPDGLLLATAGGGSRPGAGVFAATAADNAAWLWDTASGSLVSRLAGHDDPVSAVAFSAAGNMFATAGRDRIARLWDLRSCTSQPLRDTHLSTR
jgi:serine/threonine-protein kinase